MVGSAWNVGHALTLKALTDAMQKLICHSCLQLASAEQSQLEKAQCMKPCREKSFIFSKYDFDSHCVQLPTLKMFDCPFVAPEEQEDIQTGAVADKDMEASDRGATKIIKKGELPTSKIKTL